MKAKMKGKTKREVSVAPALVPVDYEEEEALEQQRKDAHEDVGNGKETPQPGQEYEDMIVELKGEKEEEEKEEEVVPETPQPVPEPPADPAPEDEVVPATPEPEAASEAEVETRDITPEIPFFEPQVDPIAVDEEPTSPGTPPPQSSISPIADDTPKDMRLDEPEAHTEDNGLVEFVFERPAPSEHFETTVPLNDVEMEDVEVQEREGNGAVEVEEEAEPKEKPVVTHGTEPTMQQKPAEHGEEEKQPPREEAAEPSVASAVPPAEEKRRSVRQTKLPTRLPSVAPPTRTRSTRSMSVSLKSKKEAAVKAPGRFLTVPNCAYAYPVRL